MSEDVKGFLEELKEYSNGGVSGLYPPEEVVKEFLNYVEQLQEENEELKSKLENNIKINVADHKYASEMEDKYLVEHNILTEFEKWLENKLIYTFTKDDMTMGYKKGLSISLDKLQELKGDKNET